MTGYGFDRSVLPASYVFTVATLRYSAARPSRNPIVIVLLLVLVLDRPISDDENENDDEDERFTRPATIWTDTDRLQVCATGASNSVNRHPTEPEDS